MKQISSSNTRYRLSEADWEQAVLVYELGHKHGCELAPLFGVSPQAISQGLRKRGAVKGIRAHETVAALNRELDVRDALLSQAAQDQIEQRLMLLDRMVTAVVKADSIGALADFGPGLKKFARR